MNVAIAHVLHGKPDLIVSGINKGWNIGDDVTYSGTVSGALEGRCSASQHRGVDAEPAVMNRFPASGKAAAMIAEAVLERGMPKLRCSTSTRRYGPNKGFRATVQAQPQSRHSRQRRIDPRHGRTTGSKRARTMGAARSSDYQAVRDGYVGHAVHPDMTAHDALEFVEGLPLVSPR